MSVRRPAGDDGAAVVEFVLLAVVLVVPFAYAVLCVLEVERAAFALTAASREAGRAFVTAPSGSAADERGRSAAQLVLDDHGVPTSVRIRFDCTADPCLTPDERVTVELRTRVELPLIPNIGGVPASVPVTVTHTEVVDRYREVRP